VAGQLDRIDIAVLDAAVPGGAEELGQRVIYVRLRTSSKKAGVRMQRPIAS
jgi:hypothetical protein